MTTASERLKQIQPNIVRHCNNAFAARLHLFQFSNPTEGREWLRTVTSLAFKASEDSRVWLNVSFTFAGLAALGVDKLDLADFPEAFRVGMAGRSKLLGDQAAAFEAVPTLPHVALVVLSRVDRTDPLFADLLEAGRAAQSRSIWSFDNAGMLARLKAHLDSACEGELSELTQPKHIHKVAAFDLHHPIVLTEGERPVIVEYFGFRDGISQPRVQAEDGSLSSQIIVSDDRAAPSSLLRHGTFMVTRMLSQDVDQFWETMDEKHAGAGFESAEALAEFLVGRRRDGQILEPASQQSSEEVPPAFVSSERDEQTPPGCPFQSHVRRVNPQLDPSREPNPMTPRLLRRGLSFYERGRYGLMFIAFNADIERQFEFIQSNWIQRGNHAGGLSGHCDPLTSIMGADVEPHAPTFVAARSGSAAVSLRLPDFVALRWGEYFFLPARAALEHISDPAPKRASPLVPEALRYINDSQLARSFWQRCVPDEGLRLENAAQGYVFVKHSASVRAIVSDPRASQGFSVCEYGRRLRSISGPFVLAMDVDTADYQREVQLMRVIPRALDKNAEIRETSKRATAQFLQAHVAGQRLRDRNDPMRSYELIAVALSAVWGNHFGLPGPGRGSLLTWAQEITDAVFRQGPDAIKVARAEHNGKELRAYVLDRIVEARASADQRSGLHLLLEEFAGFSDDDSARMLTGIVVGSLTAVAGTFVPGLARWALQNASKDLASVLRETQANAREYAWPLYKALARALENEQLGGPDYLYRTYRGAETSRFQLESGQPHIPIEPGDIVVAWIGGASQDSDSDDTEIRFGAGQHMCPGREMARAIIDGILAGLSECTALKAADARGLTFAVTLGA
ncbi:MAG TPA: hypothetical protein VFN67_22280 [Polyangiales bacterium]|nr:hypothetical protein [Polyangiales bacterium]